MIVLYDNEEMEEQAGLLAQHLKISLCRYTEEGKSKLDAAEEDDLLALHFTREGLCLKECKIGQDGQVRQTGRAMRGDFSKMLRRLRHNNLTHETLVKAARFKNQAVEGRPLTAVDATAGMGEDSLLLAAAGFHVTMFEQDPVIAALLQDTLERSAQIPELAPIAARMTLCEGDSIAGMKELAENGIAPDLILLDPMFPERRKSGLIKKKFQLLQQLEKPCANEEDLLEAAIGARPQRIVIKRPVKGPYLAGKLPSYSIRGKTIRYDCIVMS